jgi:hypothetical protein
MSAAPPRIALASVELGPELGAEISAEVGAVRVELCMPAFGGMVNLGNITLTLDQVAALNDALISASCVAEEMQFHADIDTAYRLAHRAPPPRDFGQLGAAGAEL